MGAHYWLLVPGVGTVKAPQGYQRDFPHEDQAPVPALQAAAQTPGSLPYSSIGTLGKTVTYHDGL